VTPVVLRHERFHRIDQFVLLCSAFVQNDFYTVLTVACFHYSNTVQFRFCDSDFLLISSSVFVLGMYQIGMFTIQPELDNTV